jgi:hypothetical protein
MLGAKLVPKKEYCIAKLSYEIKYRTLHIAFIIPMAAAFV